MPAESAALASSLEPWIAERIRVVRDGDGHRGAFVLYWMRSAARGHENPALDAALRAADRLGLPAFVYQAVSERYPYASDRHHTFLLEGARDVAAELRARGIGHALHVERPGHRGPHLRTLAAQAALVVTEDMPVPPLNRWTDRLAQAVPTPLWAVDTACVVPMPLVPRAHDRAFAFRKATADLAAARITRPWPDAEAPTPPFLPDLPFTPVDPDGMDIPDLVASCAIDHLVGPIPHTPGGARAGYGRWRLFRDDRLRAYARRRNDAADLAGASRMSPYLHHGHVSPLRIAREAAAVPGRGAEKFLDELLVWRELAYRWCLDHPDPHRLAVLPTWARETLAEHADDPRVGDADWETLARGRLGEPLWDLCQRSLLQQGELHNNVRMTWAKVVPFWTRTPQEALDRLIDLNHRYALDGRDPNSYAGILWSLGGFDRPFRPAGRVLGAVRGRSPRKHAERLDLDRYRAIVTRPRQPFGPRIGVVGAGVAGLTCARTLADHGLEVVVYDKGRGPGGRLSTRRRDGARWDHGAPCFPAEGEVFRRHVEAWARAGIVARWPEGGDTWVGVPGMNAVVKHLAADVDVRFAAGVHGVEATDTGWVLRNAAGEVLDRVDGLVLAVPAPQAVALLPDLAEDLTDVAFAPARTVLARFDPPLPDGPPLVRPVEGPLARVVRNRTKPARGPADAVVAHATADWSQAHVEDAPEAVAEALLPALLDALGTAQAPATVDVHRWRYAQVSAPLGRPCLPHLDRSLVVCGGWCLGPTVEHAFDSGAAAAGRLLGRW